MRTPRLDWNKLREEMLDLKYNKKMGLTAINFYLFDKYGKSFTAARLSQVFKKYSQETEIAN